MFTPIKAGSVEVYASLGPVEPGRAETLLTQLIPVVLPRLAAWAQRTVDVLPKGDSSAGYRDLLPDEQQRHSVWQFPRSNAAERIEAFLWLSKRTGDSCFAGLAMRYARAMVDDPLRGIYQGDEEDGIGQVWYWRDLGAYATNYTIRVPSALLALARESGESRFNKIADLCGRQLIHSQQIQTGILREGWWPQHPPKEYVQDVRTKSFWISPVKINSRVGYVTRAFADLYVATQQTRYHDALMLAVEGLEHYQNADGSFPADIRCDRYEVQDPTIKGHFMTYILNGCARAACLMPKEPRLAAIAVRLGQFLLRRFRQPGCLPYGDMNSNSIGEQYVWRSANPDSIFGLAWLSKLTGDPVYREVAARIALDTLLKVLDCPENPDLHGGIPIWPNPDTHNIPEFDGYHHFWTLLGLAALEETAIAR